MTECHRCCGEGLVWASGRKGLVIPWAVWSELTTTCPWCGGSGEEPMDTYSDDKHRERERQAARDEAAERPLERPVRGD